MPCILSLYQNPKRSIGIYTPQRDAALGNTSLWFVFRGNIEAQGFFLFLSFLPKPEHDDDLGNDDAQEHCQRIDGSVSQRGLVAFHSVVHIT